MSAASVKSLADRKVRRQKLFIAVGSVALLAILGFQLPKLLGGGGDETAATLTTTIAPAVDGSTSPAAGKLPDTDRLVIQRNSDQLLSFGLFKSKDPFVQQLALKAAAPASTPPATRAATKTSSEARPSAPIGVGLTPVTTTTGAVPSPGASNPPAGSETPATAPVAGSPSAPAAPETAPTSVSISTNGVCETIAVKATFPSGEDIFRVVSIAENGKSVEIAVVGGSYDSGQATATLKLGEKLTLINTADGTRYVISLQSKCDPEQQDGRSGTTPATTSPASTTPVPPAPAATTTAATTTTTTTTTPATTTPIVTDALDPTTAPFG
jgi:hypothetical protein